MTCHPIYLLLFTILCCRNGYAQSRSYIDKLKNSFTPASAATHVKDGLEICAYYVENNIDSLRKYGAILEEYGIKTHNQKILSDLYRYYGVTYLDIRDDSCILYLEKSQAIRKKIGEPKALAEIYSNIAHFYAYNTAKSDKAVEKIRQAIEIYESLMKKGQSVENELAYCYTILGECFKAQNLTQNAFIYFHKAEECLRRLKGQDFKTRAFVFKSLGLIYMEQKSYDEALCYHQEANLSIQKQKLVRGNGDILRRMGRIYYFKKDYLKALDYHKQAEKILIADKDSSYTGYVWLNLAQDYKALHEIAPIIEYGEKAFKRGKYREIPGLIIPAGKLLAEAYTATQDFEKALYYTNEVGIAKDTLANVSNKKVLDDLIAKYELKEKDERIAHLNQENVLKNAVVKAQRNQILAGVGLGVLLLALGAILLFNYRKKLKTNALLSSQKQELQALNQVKDRLFSIISHDLRSPLNDLSLFLQLDHQKKESLQILPILSDKVFHVQQLLDNLLQWSVLQMKNVQPNLTHIEVFDLVEEIKDLYQGIAAHQNITIENNVSHNAVAFCDENMLRFVLRNLLTNALKFSASGKKIRFRAEEQANRIIISVEDEGLGMNAKTLGNLFSQAGGTQKGLRDEKGTGLGLMLCKEYIEKKWRNYSSRISRKYRHQSTCFVKSLIDFSYSSAYNNRTTTYLN